MKEAIRLGKLDQKEFDRRCNEIFESREGDKYYSIRVVGDKVKILMCENDAELGVAYSFHYEPDMADRPQALEYLLGNRDDFDD